MAAAVIFVVLIMVVRVTMVALRGHMEKGTEAVYENTTNTEKIQLYIEHIGRRLSID
jgi:hypothetical protein